MPATPFIKDSVAMEQMKALFPQHAEKLKMKKNGGRVTFYIDKKPLCTGTSNYEVLVIAQLGAQNSANQNQ